MNNCIRSLAIGVVICGSTVLVAQPPEQSPFDGLLDGITVQPQPANEVSSPPDGSPLAAAYEAMVRAQQQLDRGELVEGVVTAQQTAIDALDSLLQQLQQPPPPEPPENAPPEEQQTQASEDQQAQPPESGDAGDPQPTPRGGDGETPSEEQLTGEADTDPAALERTLQQSVWGHLPDRVRQQLQASMPDEFHPRYKQAIAEYFRQLSHPGTAR